ncbi:DNA mismatch repair protein MSH3 [Labeo rohita]|uniref:DNA mismatch repair protein MSH3 n=1 Tax=Labeo rohita TaxID=84645 RepID=A0ABQ8L9Q3_LABRO|nr:DNA mismatch repair protein MSH3 [Labeo rohita]
MFRDSLFRYQKAVKTAKSRYFTEIINKNFHKPKILFNILNAAFRPSLSSFTEVSSLSCDDSALRMGINPVLSDPTLPISCTAVLSNFTPITEKYLIDLVAHLKPTGSSIDVVPPYFLKQVLDVVGPHLLCLINHSLTVPNPNLGGLSSCVKQYVKKLGVVFDEHLRFDRQINSVVKTSFFQLRLLSKAKSFLSFKNFEKVIHAFITTRLDYCNSLYVGISQTALSRLQLVQNAAARLLAGVHKRDHITPVLRSLHWLPVRYRVNFKILLIVYKSLHGMAPPYISDLLIEHSVTRTLRSSNQRLLLIPQTKRKCRGDRAFASIAPRLWNDLPSFIRMASSVATFKSKLKTYLFDNAFNFG